MKLVVVLLALLLLVWLVLGSTRRRTKDRQRGSQVPPTPRSPAQVEGMVACAHCGVHLPASLALQDHGHSYCGAAHRDAGPTAPPVARTSDE